MGTRHADRGKVPLNDLQDLAGAIPGLVGPAANLSIQAPERKLNFEQQQVARRPQSRPPRGADHAFAPVHGRMSRARGLSKMGQPTRRALSRMTAARDRHRRSAPLRSWRTELPADTAGCPSRSRTCQPAAKFTRFRRPRPIGCDQVAGIRDAVPWPAGLSRTVRGESRMPESFEGRQGVSKRDGRAHQPTDRCLRIGLTFGGAAD